MVLNCSWLQQAKPGGYSMERPLGIPWGNDRAQIILVTITPIFWFSRIGLLLMIRQRNR